MSSLPERDMSEQEPAKTATYAQEDTPPGHGAQAEKQERPAEEPPNLDSELSAVDGRSQAPYGHGAMSLKENQSRRRQPDAPVGGGLEPGRHGAGNNSDEDGEDEGTYPEGGLRAWLVVLGSWMALVASLGLMNTIGVLQSFVHVHQLASYSEATVGWIFSLYTFLAFFLGLYIGPIFDKHGPRYLILLGTVLLAVGVMLLSICTEYWHFIIVFGVVNGVATGLLFTPSITAIGHFFRERRGLATGIAYTGGGVGGVVFPLMLTSLFERVGWAWAVRSLGFVCVALTGAANFLIRSRLAPARNASAQPDWRIFRDPAMALTTLGIFLMEFGLFIPLAYLPLYARAKGFDERFASRTLTVLNAASVFGRALPGWWADIIGPGNANALAIVQSIVACLAVWLPAGGTTAGILVFAVLFGFASGTNISLTPLCVGRLCKTQHYGRYYATAYTLVSFACLVDIPAAGAIVGATAGSDSYRGLILFTGLLYCGALVAFVSARVHVVGWNPLAVF